MSLLPAHERGMDKDSETQVFLARLQWHCAAPQLLYSTSNYWRETERAPHGRVKCELSLYVVCIRHTTNKHFCKITNCSTLNKLKRHELHFSDGYNRDGDHSWVYFFIGYIGGCSRMATKTARMLSSMTTAKGATAQQKKTMRVCSCHMYTYVVSCRTHGVLEQRVYSPCAGILQPEVELHWNDSNVHAAYALA